jgi:hypothetical protein
MHHPFVQYLIDRDYVPGRIARKLAEKKRYIREPVGMIAVAHGLLHPNQIDEVLDDQRESKRLFGEIAVDRGFLTQQEVDTLIKIQEFRVAADIAESLALAGVMTCEDAVQYLGSYLIRDHEVAAMIADH